MSTTDETPKIVRPFSEFLFAQRKGALHEELTEALNELLTAVSDQSKPATLTLQIIVRPGGKKNAEVVAITDLVKLKLPEVERGEALWFIDNDHNLTRDNPRQQQFNGLRSVDEPSTEAAASE